MPILAATYDSFQRSAYCSFPVSSAQDDPECQIFSWTYLYGLQDVCYIVFLFESYIVTCEHNLDKFKSLVHFLLDESTLKSTNTVHSVNRIMT